MKKIIFATLSLFMVFLHGWDGASGESKERKRFEAFEVDYQNGDTIRAYVQFPKSTKVIFKHEQISHYKLMDDDYYAVHIAESRFGNQKNILEIELKEDQNLDTTLLSVYTESGKVFKFELFPILRSDQKLKPNALVEVRSFKYDQKSKRFYWWDSNKQR